MIGRYVLPRLPTLRPRWRFLHARAARRLDVPPAAPSNRTTSRRSSSKHACKKEKRACDRPANLRCEARTFPRRGGPHVTEGDRPWGWFAFVCLCGSSARTSAHRSAAPVPRTSGRQCVPTAPVGGTEPGAGRRPAGWRSAR
jgi:hypothetical protein